jgi:hypothetical protein
MYATFTLGLCFLAVVQLAEACRSCDENGDAYYGGISNLSNITNVKVKEGEVIGFQCNVTGNEDELHICINSSTPYGEHKDKRNDDLDDFLDSKFQHNRSMVEVTDKNELCIEKFVNFRILTEINFKTKVNTDGGQKDRAFVALIPSGSIVYCVYGSPLDCFNGTVLAGLASKYIISSPSMTGTTVISSSSSYLSSTRNQPDSSSTPMPTSDMPTATSRQRTFDGPLGGTLGALSVTSIAIIISLILYIIYLKRAHPIPEIQNKLPSSLPELHNGIMNTQSTCPPTITHDSN